MNCIEHINCFRCIGSISLIHVLNYTLNQNLTFSHFSSIYVQFRFWCFWNSFYLCGFLVISQILFVQFKFKKHMFLSEIRHTLDNSVWETFSMQSNLQAFPRLFFPYYPVRWFIMWYETYYSVILWHKKNPASKILRLRQVTSAI